MANCTKCWCPEGSGHNSGCPDAVDALPDAQAQWDRGYQYGFNDNFIQQYNYRYYNKSYIFGYRCGLAKIDQLVDDAAQSRY